MATTVQRIHAYNKTKEMDARIMMTLAFEEVKTPKEAEPFLAEFTVVELRQLHKVVIGWTSRVPKQLLCKRLAHHYVPQGAYFDSNDDD